MRAGNLSASNLSSPASAKAAYDIAHQDMTNEVGYDISQTLPPGDGILRFTNGEPVTAESKIYQTQQATSYQNQALQLYNSEVAKKPPPGRDTE